MGKAVRLDKFLADAGAGTRSEVKKYIQKGKVRINGVPAKKPEIKVSEEDEVILDGNRVSRHRNLSIIFCTNLQVMSVQQRISVTEQ